MFAAARPEDISVVPEREVVVEGVEVGAVVVSDVVPVLVLAEEEFADDEEVVAEGAKSETVTN